jgi:putative flavoprotein involved in K+ transport
MSAQTPRMHEAIVIGAGPGGLATAACLKNANIETLLLERGEDVATTWRNGYDRLRINTSSWFSHLPGRRFPRKAGRWIARDELVAYYRDYVELNGLRIQTDVEAKRLEQTGDDWEIATSRGLLRARIVIVATGRQNTPAIPDWPGLAEFQGELTHSSRYRDAMPFRDRRVLVVGTGNSGTDIALDLAEAGAAKVWLSARRPPHIVRRELWGIPHDAFGVAGRHAPRRFVDAGSRFLRMLTVGDLSEIGLPIPDDGAVTRFEEDGRVPTIDSGDFVSAVRGGQISIVAGVNGLASDSALLADGTRVEPEAIVAATGYRPDLNRLVGHLGLLDAKGIPIVHGIRAHASAPNLHFVGFVDPRSGQLRELRLQAKRVARLLALRG